MIDFYVFEMDVESAEPRYFGRADDSPLDWTDFQIAGGQEGHPIFKGMKQVDIKKLSTSVTTLGHLNLLNSHKIIPNSVTVLNSFILCRKNKIFVFTDERIFFGMTQKIVMSNEVGDT